MAHSKPTPTQQALYQFVVQNASIGPKARLVSHHLPNAVNHEHLVATAQLQGDAPAHLTMSLPQLSPKVFIGITDAYPELLSELIANFSADSETNDALAIGHAEEIHSPTLKQCGWNAILMTSPSKRLDGFPDTTTIEGEDFDFILVTLITESEYKHWRKQGYDSLMAQFGAQKRDWPSFYQINKGSSQLTGSEKSITPKTAQPDDRDMLQTTTTPSAETPSADNPQIGTHRAESSTPKTRSQTQEQARPSPVVSQPIRSAILTPNRPMPSNANSTNSRPNSAAPNNKALARSTQRNTLTSARAARQPIPNQPASASNQSVPLQRRQTTTRAPAPHAGSPNTATNTNYVTQTRTHSQQAKDMPRQRAKTPVTTGTKRLNAAATPVPPPFSEDGPIPYNEYLLTHNPLSIDLGVEPSEAFITGNTEALSVGQRPSHSTKGKKAAAEQVPASRQQPDRKAVPKHDNEHYGDEAKDMAYDNYLSAPVKPAKFGTKAPKHPSPKGSGVASKRMQASAKTGEAKRATQRNSRANAKKRLQKQATKKHTPRRHRQLSALKEAITGQRAGSIASNNGEKQSVSQNISDNFPEHYDDQASLQDLSQTLEHRPISQWQVLGETALGTLLLVGGLFTTLYFMDTEIPTASIFPGVFAIAGIVTLASAFKDALQLEYTDTDTDN